MSAPGDGEWWIQTERLRISRDLLMKWMQSLIVRACVYKGREYLSALLGGSFLSLPHREPKHSILSLTLLSDLPCWC